MKILLAHGRNQQERSREQVEEELKPALLEGLRRAGHTATIDEGDLHVFYYADLLPNRYGALAKKDELAAMGRESVSDRQRALAEQIMAQAQPRRSITSSRLEPLSIWTELGALAHDLAERLQIDDDIVLYFMSDVDRYFDAGDGSRTRVLTQAQQEIAEFGGTPVILVGHSLGGLIFYDLLRSHKVGSVKELISAGSHFAIGQVREFLREKNAPLEFPDEPDVWTNLVAENDVFPGTMRIGEFYPDRTERRTGPRSVQHIVFDSGVGPRRSHAATRYLSSESVGTAVKAAIERTAAG